MEQAGSSPSTAGNARRKRAQFSLLSLLSVVIALGSVMGYWFSQRETNRLQAENRKLREELGVLNVDDPSKYYARSLRLNENLRWRWRIYIPEKGNFSLHVQTAGIGETGLASGSGSMSTFVVERGEYTIEAEVRKTEPGQAEIHVLMPVGKLTTGGQTKMPGYEDWAAGSHSTSKRGEASAEFDPTRPLELLRVRGMLQTSPGSSSTSPAPSPGLLIWLQREK